MKEDLKIKGNVKLYLNDELVRDVDNLIVTAGLTWLATKLYAAGSPGDDMSHIGLGSGVTAADVSDTDLESILGSREALDSTVPSTNTVVYTAAFEAGDATGAITEAGLFNASTAGTMLCHTIFSVVNKAAGDALTVVWTITIS